MLKSDVGRLRHRRRFIPQGLQQRRRGAAIAAGSQGHRRGAPHAGLLVPERLDEGRDGRTVPKRRQAVDGRDRFRGPADLDGLAQSRDLGRAPGRQRRRNEAARESALAMKVDSGDLAEPVELEVEHAAVGGIVGAKAERLVAASQIDGRCFGCEDHPAVELRRGLARVVTADAGAGLARADVDPAHFVHDGPALRVDRLDRQGPIGRNADVERPVGRQRRGAQLDSLGADVVVLMPGGAQRQRLALDHADGLDAAPITGHLLRVEDVLAEQEPAVVVRPPGLGGDHVRDDRRPGPPAQVRRRVQGLALHLVEHDGLARIGLDNPQDPAGRAAQQPPVGHGRNVEQRHFAGHPLSPDLVAQQNGREDRAIVRQAGDAPVRQRRGRAEPVVAQPSGGVLGPGGAVVSDRASVRPDEGLAGGSVRVNGVD